MPRAQHPRGTRTAAHTQVSFDTGELRAATRAWLPSYHPSQVSCERGHAGVARSLLGAGAAADAARDDGTTPLAEPYTLYPDPNPDPTPYTLTLTLYPSPDPNPSPNSTPTPTPTQAPPRWPPPPPPPPPPGGTQLSLSRSSWAGCSLLTTYYLLLTTYCLLLTMALLTAHYWAGCYCHG